MLFTTILYPVLISECVSLCSYDRACDLESVLQRPHSAGMCTSQVPVSQRARLQARAWTNVKIDCSEWQLARKRLERIKSRARHTLSIVPERRCSLLYRNRCVSHQGTIASRLGSKLENFERHHTSVRPHDYIAPVHLSCSFRHCAHASSSASAKVVPIVCSFQ